MASGGLILHGFGTDDLKMPARAMACDPLIDLRVETPLKARMNRAGFTGE